MTVLPLALLAALAAADPASLAPAPPPAIATATPPAKPDETTPTAPAPSDTAQPSAGATPPVAKPIERPPPRAAFLEELSGTVREIDRTSHRLTVDTSQGPVTLGLDRNTLVYGPNGLSTVLQVAPGAPIRAGRNADSLAYWIQLRAPSRASAPTSPPGQGTGPGGGAAPSGPAEGGTSAPAGPTSVPGGVPGTTGSGR